VSLWVILPHRRGTNVITPPPENNLSPWMSLFLRHNLTSLHPRLLFRGRVKVKRSFCHYLFLGVSKKTEEQEPEPENRETGVPVPVPDSKNKKPGTPIVPGFYRVTGNQVKYIYIYIVRALHFTIQIPFYPNFFILTSASSPNFMYRLEQCEIG
jgi:hypothetical protein